MSIIDERMQEIQNAIDQYGDQGYYGALVRLTGGTRSAAIADLAIDGNYWYLDLRRAPFAGNEELKALAREAVAAHARLHAALLELTWLMKEIGE